MALCLVPVSVVLGPSMSGLLDKRKPFPRRTFGCRTPSMSVPLKVSRASLLRALCLSFNGVASLKRAEIGRLPVGSSFNSTSSKGESATVTLCKSCALRAVRRYVFSRTPLRFLLMELLGRTRGQRGRLTYLITM